MRPKLFLVVAIVAVSALVPLQLIGAHRIALTAPSILAAMTTPPAPAALPQASAARLRRPPTPTPTPAPAQPGTCTLSVPPQPLSAWGLAIPWMLGGAGCHESDPNTAAFVQGAVIDRATGQISVYDPLVVDRGSRPALWPVVPTLPRDSVVGIWVGFNGTSLTLTGPGRDRCVNGADGSIFGQNAFCNADAFFDAANAAIQSGKLTVPALGMARDGKPCPTTRDFSIVDQDQSDNTTTTYLATADGRMAQDTPQNRAKLSGAKTATNGSDERLLAIAMDHALGCTAWSVPDLADSTHAQRVTALPLNELMAAARQAPPVALIPALDPFVQGAHGPSLAKLNAFREGTDQPRVDSIKQADTSSYCENLYHVGLPRIAADRALTSAGASPAPDVADSLFTFVAQRYAATVSNDQGFLQCLRSLGLKQNPVTLSTNQDGVVTDAKIALPGNR